jgi:hypothetical protein
MEDWNTGSLDESPEEVSPEEVASEEAPQRSAFYPDEDIQPLFEQHIRGGWIESTYEVTVRCINSGESVRMLVLAGDSELADIHQDIRDGLRVVNLEHSYLEPYFWLFWRGWSGMLDAPTARLLPVGQDVLAKMLAGVQLRGDDLEALATGLGWFHAMNAVNWGETGNWNLGTLSTPHSKSRRIVREYILGRMADLYGEDYAKL